MLQTAGEPQQRNEMEPNFKTETLNHSEGFIPPVSGTVKELINRVLMDCERQILSGNLKVGSDME